MIVRDAFAFIVPLVISAAAAVALGLYPAGILLLLLAGFVAFFFRNPRREIPRDPGIIVSPADGRVVKIERVGNVTRLSIFLSLFDVHVNRGQTLQTAYSRPGADPTKSFDRSEPLHRWKHLLRVLLDCLDSAR